MDKLKRIVAECDRRGLVVDVTLTRASKTPGWGLPNLEAHEACRRGDRRRAEGVSQLVP